MAENPEKIALAIEEKYKDVPTIQEIDRMTVALEEPDCMHFMPYGSTYKSGRVMTGNFEIKQRVVADLPTALHVARRNEPWLAEKVKDGYWIANHPALSTDEAEEIELDLKKLWSEIEVLRQVCVSLALNLNEVIEEYDVDVESLKYYKRGKDDKN
jgi:hypothetical protein